MIMHIRTFSTDNFEAQSDINCKSATAACSKTPGVNAPRCMRVHRQRGPPDIYTLARSRGSPEESARKSERCALARLRISLPARRTVRRGHLHSDVRRTCLTIDTNGQRRRVLNLLSRGRRARALSRLSRRDEARETRS